MDKTSLGNRMKTYEQVTSQKLVRRMPVLMRLDGKAFHTFTRGLERPYSEKLRNAMNETAADLVRGIQGAVIAYVQSDEISILIRDWDTITTDAWFDNKVQKMVSISASIATESFNRHFSHPSGATGLFDSRVWNLPKDEVNNYFIWRQQDATRNSIQMIGQANFSHKQLHGQNVSAIQDMLMSLDPPINWNDQPTWAKRGSCVLRSTNESGRSYVKVDNEIPIFTANREYIDHLLDVH